MKNIRKELNLLGFNEHGENEYGNNKATIFIVDDKTISIVGEVFGSDDSFIDVPRLRHIGLDLKKLFKALYIL